MAGATFQQWLVTVVKLLGLRIGPCCRNSVRLSARAMLPQLRGVTQFLQPCRAPLSLGRAASAPPFLRLRGLGLLVLGSLFARLGLVGYSRLVAGSSAPSLAPPPTHSSAPPALRPLRARRVGGLCGVCSEPGSLASHPPLWPVGYLAAPAPPPCSAGGAGPSSARRPCGPTSRPARALAGRELHAPLRADAVGLPQHG